MSRHRRTLLVSCLVTAVLAVGSPAAMAEPTGWTPTGSTYASTDTNVVPVELLVDASGRQTAVFTADHDVWAANRAPGGAWGTPVKLSDGTVVDGSVDAAGNDEGDGFVAWQSVELGAPGLRTSRRSNGGPWSPGALLTTPNEDPDPAVSVDPQGTVHLAYIDSDGGVDRAYGTFAQASGGAFQAPHELGTTGVEDVDVASSGSGVTRYVVVGSSGGSSTIDTFAYSTRGGAGWTGATNLRTVAGRQLGALDLNINQDDAALAWVEKVSDSDYRIGGGVRPSGGSWTTGPVISGLVSFYTEPAAVPVPGGRALVTWSQPVGAGDERRIKLAFGSALGWDGAVDVSAGHTDAAAQMVVGADGTSAVLGWLRIENGAVTAVARRYRVADEQLDPELPVGGSLGSAFAVAPGGDFFAVRAYAGSGANRLFSSVLDRHAPVGARLTGPGGISLSSVAPVGWTASDTWSRPLRYDVLARSAGVDGVFGGPGTWRAGTTATSGAYPVTPGRTYCFAVRARDAVGNLGAYSAQRCTTTPVDDRTFVGSGWRSVGGSAYYRGTAKQTKKKGKALALGNVRARTITVYASRGKKLGRVAVRLGGTTIAVINTKGPAAARRAYVVRLPSARTGTLQLIVLSKKKVVRIDGVATSPF